MMNEKILNEAISRLKNLDLNENVVNDFKNGKLLMSNEIGIVTNPDEDIKDGLDYLKSLKLTPYHVLKTSTTFGIIYSFLFVSEQEDEWEYERATKDYVSAYCLNKTNPLFSEFGDIFFIKMNDGLIRKG